MGTAIALGCSPNWGKIKIFIHKTKWLGLIISLFLWGVSALSAQAPIVVGVLDTGIDATHPRLRDHIVDWSSYATSMDDNDPQGHGTHVAGLVLGVNRTSPLVPVLLMVFKYDFFHPRSFYDALCIAEKFGVRMMNVSITVERTHMLSRDELTHLSTDSISEAKTFIRKFYASKIPLTTPEDFENAYLKYQNDFIEELNWVRSKIKELENKMLIVAAAGNDGKNVDFNSIDPDSNRIEPASLPFSNILSVMNLDENDMPYGHNTHGPGPTNYGPHTIHVGARGTHVRSTVPHSGYAELTGTSQAAPKIAHVCAKLMQDLILEGIDPTPQAIKQRLYDTLPYSEALRSQTIWGKYLRDYP